jgi:hypothetical protein
LESSDSRVRTTGTASDTSTRSVIPYVNPPVNWLTVDSMLFSVETTSARPPPVSKPS